MADLAVWQRTIVDEEGNVIPGAEIEVRREEDDSLATLYADRAGETPLANPLAADMSGFVRFFAQGDAYTITAVGAGSTRTWRFDPTGRLQEFDRVSEALVADDAADLLSARSNLGTFSIVADVQNSHIPPVLDSIRTNGYYDPGDGGGALYERVASEPSHNSKVQSADGSWWTPVVPFGYAFDSVSDMQASRLVTPGARVRTLGYYSPGDGGGNDYEIVAAGTGTDDGGSFIDLSGSGLQARGLFTDGVNVKQFGAVGDFNPLNRTGADDTFAIASSIAYTQGTGRELKVPAGYYKVSGKINISDSLAIVGEGWAAYNERDVGGYRENTPGSGSFIYTDSDYTGVLFDLSNAPSSVRFEDIAFDQYQPAPDPGWTPIEYNWRIFVGPCEDVSLVNVFSKKSTKFLRSERSSERVTLDGVWGHNLGVFVDIDSSTDINRINNLHLWPFWSLSDPVREYTLDNSVGIISGRNDNALWSNVFVIAHKRCIEFKNSETQETGTITNKFHLSNSDLDASRCSIYIGPNVNGVTGQVSNVSTHGRSNQAPDSKIIHILGNRSRIQFSNFRANSIGENCVNIQGNNNILSFSELYVDDWGTVGGTEALFVVSGVNNFIEVGEGFILEEEKSNVFVSDTGTGTRIKLHGNQPQKLINLAGTQTIDNNTLTKLEFTDVSMGAAPNKFFSFGAAQSRITIRYPGVYQVVASVEFRTASVEGNYMIQSRLNGSENIAVSRVSGLDTESVVLSCQGIIEAGSGDYVEAYAQQNTGFDGVGVGNGAARTFLYISKVG